MEGKKRFTSSTIWRLLLFVLVLLLIAGGTSIFWGRGSDYDDSAMGRFVTLLDDKRIKDARSIYYEELFGDVMLQAEADDKTLKALQSVASDFAQGRFDYETALNAIRAFEQSGIFLPSLQIEEAYTRIHEINEANLSVQAARTAFAAGQYLLAAEYYDDVPLGHRLYPTAIEWRRRSLNHYRETVIREAALLQDEGQYQACVQLLETALVVMPEDTALVDAYGDALVVSDDRYRQHIIDLARAQSDKGDVAFGLTILETAIAYLHDLNLSGQELPADHSLKQANLAQDIRLLEAEASRLQADVLQVSTASIKQALSERDYMEALRVLDEAESFMPGSRILQIREDEITTAIHYTFSDFFQGEADFLSLNPSWSLLTEWAANFGDGIVELYPAPAFASASILEIWDLPPGINHLEGELILEFNTTALESLGVAATSLAMQVTLGNGSNNQAYTLNSEQTTVNLSASLDRRSLLQLSTEIVILEETEGVTLEMLESNAVVRVFLKDARFDNDGALSPLVDYRAYKAIQAERKLAAERGSWRGLDNLNYLATSGETLTLAPFAIEKTRDVAGVNYRNVRLLSQDTSRSNRWLSDTPIRRIKGSLSWHDLTGILTLDDGELFKAVADIDTEMLNTDTVTGLVFADEKILGIVELLPGADAQAFYFDLPFDVWQIRVELASSGDSELPFVVILDLEVSP